MQYSSIFLLIYENTCGHQVQFPYKSQNKTIFIEKGLELKHDREGYIGSLDPDKCNEKIKK